MSDTEKEKDVTCFTVDGVVAEMVIEVEESQRTGYDDLTISPSKDNYYFDRNKEPLNDSKDSVDAIDIEEKENQIVESQTYKQDPDSSIEIIEEEQKEPVEDKKSKEKIGYVVEDKKCDEINECPVEDKKCIEINECVVEDKKCDGSNTFVVEDKKCDEINQITEVKMSDEINDQSVEDTKPKKIKQKSIKNNQTAKRKRRNIEQTVNGDEKNNNDTGLPRYPGRKRLANKRYTEDMITPKHKISESVDFKDNSKEVKRRKIEVNSNEKTEISNEISTKLPNKSDEQTSNSFKESVSSNESEKPLLSRSLRNRKIETENEKTTEKQNVLRKLPFRKNKDAPEVPDIKPKVFLWNGVGDGQGIRLGDIPEIRGRIQKAKSIRALYRILFFQWPTNGQDIIGEILKFNGFPFDKSSYEYTKRQSLMKIMLDKTIFHMCELLDIRKGDKLTSIKNILDFLLKPYPKTDPSTDPFWQPVVLLEKIKLDKYFDESSTKEELKLRRGRRSNSIKNLKEKEKDNSIKNLKEKEKDSSAKNLKEKDARNNFVSPARSTRSSGPRKIELIVVPDSEKITEKSKDDVKQRKAKLSASKEANNSVGKSSTKGNTTHAKESKVSTSHEMKKVTPASGITKTEVSLGKDKKLKATSMKDIKEKTTSNDKDIKLPPKELKAKTEEIKNNMSNKMKKKKIFNKKRKKASSISSKQLPKNKDVSNTQPKDDSDEYEIEMTIDSGPDMDEDTEMKDSEDKELKSEPEKVVEQKSETQAAEIAKEKPNSAVSMVTLSDSSETESAEETKLAVTASKKTSKVPMKRKGKPLRHFPKISDSIQNANFSALQRLHILLFGASDKAENLKSNILSFGGFPFLEGSDEWKQKHFLLSLLAQNNLREYLNLLCIPYVNDDQPTMINKLMRFLAVPSEESLEFNKIQPIETEVVSSVLVDKSFSSSPIAAAPKGKGESKKKVKKKKEEKKVSKRPRKILMSEEEARRLEANFAREQRALAREKKLIPFPPIPQKVHEPDTAPTLNMHNYIPPPKSKPPITDPDQLNALLQTVYKRRALKAAGAIISTPNKGQKTKLGDIENIKFLIVTSHLQDLEILHRLIYMLEASKSRIRKNIMDFDGFGFNEDSPKYKHRMDYLNSLGYEASKRISFLLGLCPLNTNIPQNDLNELIMYFLMSPCKSKQTVPITQMPITQMPSEEPHILKSTVTYQKPTYVSNAILSTPVSLSGNSGVSKKSSDEIITKHSTPIPKTGSQKAKKTFPSSLKISPVKKVLLPPSQSPVLGVSSFGNKPQKMTLLNSIPAVPSYSLPKSTVSNQVVNSTLLNTGGVVLSAPKSPIHSLVKVPVSPGSKIQVVNQSQRVNVIDPATQKIPVSLSNVPVSLSNVPVSLPNVPVSLSNVPVSLSNVPVSLSNVSGQVLQNQILLPQIPNNINNNNSIQPSQIQPALLQNAKMLLKQPTGVSGSPQEFIVQQQTPDGQQKVFKLIRLTSNHPFVSNVVNKPPIQQTVSSAPLQQQVLLTTNNPLPGNLPPGFIIMKNNPGLPQLQNLQILPNAPVKFVPLGTTNTSVSSPVSDSQPKTVLPQTENIGSSNEKDLTLPQSENTALDNSIETLSSLEDNPPTDEDLFSSIQEVILSSNFEDITLRNVIERVAAQYPNHDLTHRHNYMKECVKKIIIGT